MKVKESFKALIPKLSNEELRQLESNILSEGIRDAIITWNGYILDGHNRFDIATKHDLPFKTESKEFESEEKAKEWMILNQFGRRNLSNYQRSILALELEGLFREKAKEKEFERKTTLPKSAKSFMPEIDTRKELAKIAGVGKDTIAKVKKIQTSAPTELKEKVSTGEVSINEAYKEIRKEEKIQEREDIRIKQAQLGKEKPITVDFRLGDFEEVFKDVQDGSIDCIITDPPYPKQYLECWSKLSRFAKRVLKPNGFCIAYSGQMNLPEVMDRMRENLDYYWTFAVYHKGQTQIVNGVNLMCRWKPVLIFQNGKKRLF